MTLCVVGCNHQTTPLEVRERLAFSTPQIAAALERIKNAFPNTEAVILSTCNRVEIYTATDDGPVPTTDDIAGFLAGFHGHAHQDGPQHDTLTIAEHLYRYTETCAVEHLFNVAAGLDSMVMGEAQIISQVKQAYQSAVQYAAAGPVIHAAFQAALKTAARVACQTNIQQHRISIPSVAVADFAGQIFERFDDKNTLVIGAGQMGEETLKYLKEQGVRDIDVANRNRSRAAELAARWQGRVVDWNDLAKAIVKADLVVTATASEEPIVTAAEFAKIHDARDARPLFILDLAVPRDFEPAVGDLSEVYLYSIDDLQEACDENRRLRDKELPAAERIVAQEAERFVAEQRVRATGPLIKRLREDWQKPKEEELRRLLNKLDVSQCQEAEIRQSFDRLINKLLHVPMESIRAESRHGIPSALIDALSRLFRLRD